MKVKIPRKNIIVKIILYYLKKITNNEKFNFAIYSNDYIGRNLVFKDFYEEENLSLFQKFLKINNIHIKNFVDIGANIGNHSVYFSKFVCNVYAFEPSSKAFELLKINTKKNNIKLYQVGISNKNCTSLLAESKFNLGGSNIIKKIKKNHTFTEKIKLIKLDNYKNFINKKIDLIKIDTEGHELNVLKGTEKIIDKNLPIIILEQNAYDVKKNQSKVINFLAKKNYVFYNISSTLFNSKIFFFKLCSILMHLIFPKSVKFEKIDYKNMIKKDYAFIVALNEKLENLIK